MGPTTMRNPAHWLSLGLAFGLLACGASCRSTAPSSSTTATTTPTDPNESPAPANETCAAATLPDTPVGRQATELLDVVNSGDHTRIEALVTQRFTPQFREIAPMERHIEVMGGFHDQTGGVTVCRVEYASDTEALLLLASNRGDDLHGLSIRVEDSDPHRLSNLSIEPAPREALDDPPAPLDDAGRSAIVEGVATALDAYIFADVATKMKERIRFERDAGHYTAFTHPLPLVRRLTTDLRDVSKDKHLAIHYSAGALPPEVGSGDAVPPPPTPEQLEQMKAAAAQDGFGIAKVEILEGNIGYIDIRLFHQVDGVREAFSEAMTKLADTKALIVDVRHHHGGDPATVAFVTSYLFGDKKVHLNDLYYRRSDLTTEYWTDPKVPGKRFGKKKPIYVLTSNETFSGGEEFAYNLRVLKRATLVGETTGGGAHPVDGVRVDDHIVAIVPVGRAINPITKSNWEGKGVEPHVPVPASEALDKAKALLAAKQ
jgi:hypothetical protein